MNDILLDKIGILFINNKVKNNINNVKINLTDKNIFYNNKLKYLSNKKRDLIEYNNVIKIEYKYIFGNWKLEDSCNDDLIKNFLIEIKRLNNLLKYNNNKISIIDANINIINIYKLKNDLNIK